MHVHVLQASHVHRIASWPKVVDVDAKLCQRWGLWEVCQGRCWFRFLLSTGRPRIEGWEEGGGEIAQHCRPYTAQIWNYIVGPSLNAVFAYQSINNIYFSTHCNLTIEFDVTYLITLLQGTSGLGFTTTMESRGSGFTPYLMVGDMKDRDKLLYRCQTQVEKMVKLRDLYHLCSVPAHERIGGKCGMPHSTTKCRVCSDWCFNGIIKEISY